MIGSDVIDVRESRRPGGANASFDGGAVAESAGGLESETVHGLAIRAVSNDPVSAQVGIAFIVHMHEIISREIFDVSGRSVSTLAPVALGPGEHRLTIDTRPLPTGLYWVRLRAATGESALARFAVIH